MPVAMTQKGLTYFGIPLPYPKAVPMVISAGKQSTTEWEADFVILATIESEGPFENVQELLEASNDFDTSDWDDAEEVPPTEQDRRQAIRRLFEAGIIDQY